MRQDFQQDENIDYNGRRKSYKRAADASRRELNPEKEGRENSHGEDFIINEDEGLT